MAYKVLTDGAGSRLVRIVGMGDYMPAQMYSELESKNAELRAQIEFMARAINNAYDFIPAGALGIKSDLKQAVNYPHQTTTCYQCSKPAVLLNHKSRCIECVTENFEKTEAEFELALEGQHPVQLEAAKQTPSSLWAKDGKPDPHGKLYDCERAKLAMGQLTDDQMADAVFIYGNSQPNFEDVVAGTAKMPISYLTAAKERIRWLSRALEKALKEKSDG